MPIIGAHVSVAGGLVKAFTNAKNISAACIQIFGSSPRQWKTRTPNQQSVDQYLAAKKESEIEPVYLHAPYLVNLASPEKLNRNKSVKCLVEHLGIAESIAAAGLVFHLGSGKGMNRERAIKFTVEGMKRVLSQVPGKARLIMENSAGGGDRLGAELGEIGKIYKALKSKRVSICFDTAHAYESGMLTDFSPASLKKFFKDWDKKIGLKNLEVVHINDSKTKAFSNHDRHENIGKGFIGLKAFQNLAKQNSVNQKPWILEVPGFDGLGPDKKNIKILHGFFKD